MNKPDFEITDSWIVSNRGEKNTVDPLKPYFFISEKERTTEGSIEDTSVIFITNRECPFKCLMCDLWKNTTRTRAARGLVPGQIDWALGNLPRARHLKLYNSGSFFDRNAIPESDYREIARIISGFKSVVVESHPGFIGDKCLHFRDMLVPQLHVAMGLETAQPEMLKMLNKKMNLQDFSRAAMFLRKNQIPVRAFILLRPPFLSEEEGIYHAERSIDFAFDAGVECCIVIPVRSGNGAMNVLADLNFFHPPSVRSLEAVIEYGIGLKAGRVFADLWDIDKFTSCSICASQRIKRLETMNYSQSVPPPVQCSC